MAGQSDQAEEWEKAKAVVVMAVLEAVVAVVAVMAVEETGVEVPRMNEAEVSVVAVVAVMAVEETGVEVPRMNEAEVSVVAVVAGASEFLPTVSSELHQKKDRPQRKQGKQTREVRVGQTLAMVIEVWEVVGDVRRDGGRIFWWLGSLGSLYRNPKDCRASWSGGWQNIHFLENSLVSTISTWHNWSGSGGSSGCRRWCELGHEEEEGRRGRR